MNLSSIWSYVRRLVGNGTAATIGILLFIALLAFLLYRPAHAAEVDINAGSSFGTEGYGPTLGLTYKQEITPNKGLNFIAGTTLWGSTTFQSETVPNNWDWHLGLQSCRWDFCADLGPAFVQRIDVINGAHTNFHLGISYQLSSRWSLAIGHVSDAGTSSPNVGRQNLSIVYRLQ
jgi:hypothetical protein